VQVPDAEVTVSTVPRTEQPVEVPTLKEIAPVPEPPEVERLEVAPYATVDGVAKAVKVAWFALVTVKVCAPDVPPPGAGFTTVTADVVGVVRSEVRMAT
jgi:hypothetical protein